MTDEEMSNGEIKRNFAEIRRRLDRSVTTEAWTITTEAWDRETKHLTKQIEDAEGRSKERLTAAKKSINERIDGIEKTTDEHVEDLKKLIGDVKKSFEEYRKAKGITWDRLALWAAPIAVLLAAVYTAYTATIGK